MYNILYNIFYLLVFTIKDYQNLEFTIWQDNMEMYTYISYYIIVVVNGKINFGEKTVSPSSGKQKYNILISIINNNNLF